jgi:hypothetical protein
VRPWRLPGTSGRPLNFTVRFQVKKASNPTPAKAAPRPAVITAIKSKAHLVRRVACFAFGCHVRLCFALLLALLPAVNVSVAQERRVFVLAPSKGAALPQQCSRNTPQGVGGFWMPSSGDVAELEARLEPFLKASSSGRSALPLDQYHRQYIGFTKLGKHYIYGSFYSVPATFVSNYEATEPVLVCDGGSHFWGIVFSVDSKAFMDLAFNGVG